MKKKPILTLTAVMAAIFWAVFFCAQDVAAISGACSNCHTMHNSQGGAAEVQVLSGGSLSTSDTPQDQLLKASCIACHTGASGATNSHDAPIVLHTAAPSGQGVGATLAGGDFYWVATGLGATDSKGHNVAGLAAVDGTISYTPPGFTTAATPGALSDGTMNGGVASWSNQLTCAGTYGCHGNHSDTDSDAAVSGAHHGNTTGSATVASSPTTVGGSYRFLGGIKGLENSQWNWAETTAVHNEYFGTDGNDDYATKTTISYSCAQCHGDYHSTAGIGRTASPWVRHPSDIVLPASGEYNSYNPDAEGAYSLEAPVARGAVPSSSSATVTEGATTATGAIVMCLSCHRAHGSPYADLLRWDYTAMTAGSGTSDTGCFTCHTTKNAD